VPYTKWYRVWERTSLKDFTQEGFILGFIFLTILVHLWGTRVNKRRAKAWMSAHATILQKEFAVVGFDKVPKPTIDDAQASVQEELLDPEKLLKEKTAYEYETYATGRQNIAFLDAVVSLHKRYNPILLIVESVISFFFESIPSPKEKTITTLYAFDGKENQLVPPPMSCQRVNAGPSTYDGFVWAIVNKSDMKRLRDDRYDLSLTSTKDHPKLPTWLTVMSENAEITELLLTPALIKAVEEAGDLLNYLIITDQPIDQPQK
jgi:hypothetical protein